jgi:hypothetical protein
MKLTSIERLELNQAVNPFNWLSGSQGIAAQHRSLFKHPSSA